MMSNTKKTRVVGRSPHLRLIAIRGHFARAMTELAAAGEMLKDYPVPADSRDDLAIKLQEFNHALDAARKAAADLISSVVDAAEQR